MKLKPLKSVKEMKDYIGFRLDGIRSFIMETPTFDVYGYPSEETLEVIRTWPIKSNKDISELFHYVEKAWRYEFYIQNGGTERLRWAKIATRGWSGNEDIISALQQNYVFWTLCWLSSKRGGGYEFLTQPLSDGNDNKD
jgi:hypothetical protein